MNLLDHTWRFTTSHPYVTYHEPHQNLKALFSFFLFIDTFEGNSVN